MRLVIILSQFSSHFRNWSIGHLKKSTFLFLKSLSTFIMGFHKGLLRHIVFAPHWILDGWMAGVGGSPTHLLSAPLLCLMEGCCYLSNRGMDVMSCCLAKGWVDRWRQTWKLRGWAPFRRRPCQWHNRPRRECESVNFNTSTLFAPMDN